MIFYENRLLADDSLEISFLIFSKIGEDVAKVSSAAVVIGVLRVKADLSLLPVYISFSLMLTVTVSSMVFSSYTYTYELSHEILFLSHR